MQYMLRIDNKGFEQLLSDFPTLGSAFYFDNNILSDFKSGFRTGHETIPASSTVMRKDFSGA